MEEDLTKLQFWSVSITLLILGIICFNFGAYILINGFYGDYPDMSKGEAYIITLAGISSLIIGNCMFLFEEKNE